jgi:hypothetical protein
MLAPESTDFETNHRASDCLIVHPILVHSLPSGERKWFHPSLSHLWLHLANDAVAGPTLEIGRDIYPRMLAFASRNLNLRVLSDRSQGLKIKLRISWYACLLASKASEVKQLTIDDRTAASMPSRSKLDCKMFNSVLPSLLLLFLLTVTTAIPFLPSPHTPRNVSAADEPTSCTCYTPQSGLFCGSRSDSVDDAPLAGLCKPSFVYRCDGNIGCLARTQVFGCEDCIYGATLGDDKCSE